MTEQAATLALTVLWLVAVLAFSGGLLYGLGFLIARGEIDMRPERLLSEHLTGPLGGHYRAFCVAHASEFGRAATALLVAAHLLAAGLVFVLPLLLEG